MLIFKELAIDTCVYYSYIFLMSANNAEARNIFLNGSDISSARSQELENVKITSQTKGTFLFLPQYQVFEENLCATSIKKLNYTSNRP